MRYIVDSHAHLTSDTVYPDIDGVLQRAQEAGITKIVNICTDVKTLERGIELRRRYPWVYNAASTTPHDAHTEGEQVFPIIEKEAREGNLVAIGETGLEYHYFPETAEIQKSLLKRYIKLALELKLPIVIHCRDGFKDLFEIIDAEYAGAPGLLHCFTGSVEEARGVIERGWYLSLSGIVTFKRSQELREVAQWVPLDRLLIETDTPYLAPQTKRGKQNEPAYIVETAKMIAEVREMRLDDVLSATAANAERFFKI